jgi:threonine dehydrogenase-like Zn-dependent dehydrogenase
MAAERCDIEEGDTIAIWGCGPVGLLAIESALLLGAGRVIAIDRVPERLDIARDRCGAETLNFEDDDVLDALRVMTGGRGPDACIDAVGLEAHGSGSLGARYDDVKSRLWLATDRLEVLRQAIHACGKAGTVSIPGVYGGFLDKVPIGAAFAKGLTLRMGQTHVHRYMRPLLALIEGGVLDPSFVVSHHLPLDDAPEAYRMFRDKAGGCTKVVMHP